MAKKGICVAHCRNCGQDLHLEPGLESVFTPQSLVELAHAIQDSLDGRNEGQPVFKSGKELVEYFQEKERQRKAAKKRLKETVRKHSKKNTKKR